MEHRRLRLIFPGDFTERGQLGPDTHSPTLLLVKRKYQVENLPLPITPSMLHAICALWEDRSWCLRKIVRFDYSQRNGHKETHSTYDVNLDTIAKITQELPSDNLHTPQSTLSRTVSDEAGNQQESRRTFYVPLEWRPKGTLFGLDVKDPTTSSLHVLPRAISSLVALELMHRTIKEEFPNLTLTPCIERIIEASASVTFYIYPIGKNKRKTPSTTSSAELVTLAEEELANTRPHNAGPSPNTGATLCPLPEHECHEIWRQLHSNVRFRRQLALYTQGYIRCVEIPAPNHCSTTIIKTVEELIRDNEETSNTSLISKAINLFDASTWEIPREVCVEYSRDTHLLKATPPQGVAIRGLERRVDEFAIVRGGGEWAFWEPDKRPSPHEGLHLEIVKKRLLMSPHPDQVIAPALYLSVIMTLIQWALYYFIMKIGDGTTTHAPASRLTQGSEAADLPSVALPAIATLIAIVPAFAGSLTDRANGDTFVKARLRTHIDLLRFGSSLLIILTAIGIAARTNESYNTYIQAAGTGFYLILAVVFLDAYLQVNERYFSWRRAALWRPADDLWHSKTYIKPENEIVNSISRGIFPMNGGFIHIRRLIVAPAILAITIVLTTAISIYVISEPPTFRNSPFLRSLLTPLSIATLFLTCILLLQAAYRFRKWRNRHWTPILKAWSTGRGINSLNRT